MPASAIRPKSRAISSRPAVAHVMCDIASMPISCLMRAVSSMVFSAGFAPVLVTETKLGPSSFRRATVSRSLSSPCVGLRREELEREDRPAAVEQVPNPHRRVTLLQTRGAFATRTRRARRRAARPRRRRRHARCGRRRVRRSRFFAAAGDGMLGADERSRPDRGRTWPASPPIPAPSASSRSRRCTRCCCTTTTTRRWSSWSRCSSTCSTAPRPTRSQIMLHVHKHGLGVAGVYTREVAETRVAQVEALARAAGVPAALQHGRGLSDAYQP